ncbi:MAG: hypothetical protein IJM25_07910 [Eubacterium sp.]|nr:hypothetical protein [Eubacterium sp.]
MNREIEKSCKVWVSRRAGSLRGTKRPVITVRSDSGITYSQICKTAGNGKVRETGYQQG